VYHLEGFRVPLVVRVPQFENHCSKDSYYSLVSNKNSSQKMALSVGVQGPMTSSECKQNMHKHTPII